MRDFPSSWLLWLEAKAFSVRPSHLLGLDPTSYEAFCLDQAIFHLGSSVENHLEEAGHKPGKEEKKAATARERVFAKYLGDKAPKGKGFSDPAALFNS